MFKSNKGFTLVELIVVIAILAILAGVAIPVYNGYIKRAQDAAVVTELDAIQTAAQAANATSGKIVAIEVAPSADGKTATIKVKGENDRLASGFNSDFALFFPDAVGKYGADLGIFSGVAVELKGSYEAGATWQGGEWEKGIGKVTIGTQTAGSSIGGVTPSNPNPPADEEEEEDPNHTHSYTSKVVAPTCIDAGYTEYSCTCGDSYTEAGASATGVCVEWDANGDCVVCGTNRYEVTP